MGMGCHATQVDRKIKTSLIGLGRQANPSLHFTSNPRFNYLGFSFSKGENEMDCLKYVGFALNPKNNKALAYNSGVKDNVEEARDWCRHMLTNNHVGLQVYVAEVIEKASLPVCNIEFTQLGKQQPQLPLPVERKTLPEERGGFSTDEKIS